MVEPMRVRTRRRGGKRKEDSHDADETMEHEYRVEQPTSQSLLPVHRFKQNIKLTELLLPEEESSRLDDHSQSQKRQQQVQNSEEQRETA